MALSLHRLRITDSIYNASIPQETRGPSLPTIIAFHFATLIHPLRLLDLVLTQQFFTGMHDQGRFAVESCTRSTLSDDGSRDLTVLFAETAAPVPNTFRTRKVAADSCHIK
jgi:hypothetical protein